MYQKFNIFRVTTIGPKNKFPQYLAIKNQQSKVPGIIKIDYSQFSYPCLLYTSDAADE